MNISSTVKIYRNLASPILTPSECRECTGINPVFGAVFTQHMVTGEYDPENGWHDFRVEPLSTFSMHPASSVLHYGQAIFEGLKAYAQPDGSIAAFRPDVNAERFAASARRMAMPSLPSDLFLESIRQLVEVDQNWVPSEFGESLYLRPTMFSRDARLTTRPSLTYTFVLIACPVGTYFPNGVSPVSVWISEDYVRAVRGGTGEAKCAGNYAASFLAQQEAMQHDCDQVVWLDAIDRTTVEEMGGMNLYFVLEENGKKKLVTPIPTGSLLKGVTRASLLQVADDLGYPVEERRVTLEEWKLGCQKGTIVESFACGTAAVVTPIGTVRSRRNEFQVGDGTPGSATMEIRQRLLDIQHGRVSDTHGWLRQLVEPR
ncbi:MULTISPECIES: branched-chain amino acid aminotransferase [Paraburkholderia]|uniref:branched-chain amino acid aminotransferase n=1 Tax=Paraburkholderia TaxID=1822464 RepID=UPI00224EA1CD|nr:MULTISPECIES: branched-chain amino acid aminotransferase [Paraburkholderia]MCX4173723.1 branched-chain amino acid aminotransferase [Paraburkholderia madseniana]MDQ6461728.1 branched-chain amino acid aminotransferase [Paraburkholderia madseniana]